MCVFPIPLQQIQAQTIIVIHPGSLYLRIGRASDLNPHTLLHVVARKRLPSGAVHHDTFLPQKVPKVGNVSTVFGNFLIGSCCFVLSSFLSIACIQSWFPFPHLRNSGKYLWIWFFHIRQYLHYFTFCWNQWEDHEWDDLDNVCNLGMDLVGINLVKEEEE